MLAGLTSFIDVMLPYKKRPQTTSMVARNLVAGSLGIRANATKEQRDKEKEILRKARGLQCHHFLITIVTFALVVLLVAIVIAIVVVCVHVWVGQCARGCVLARTCACMYLCAFMMYLFFCVVLFDV